MPGSMSASMPAPSNPRGAAGDDSNIGTKPVGRPRSEACRLAILSAAYDLLAREELVRFTIERVAAAAAVGRSTIYRWWPSRGALAVDCLLHAVRRYERPEETGDVVRDLISHIDQAVGIMRGAPGRIVASIVAESQSDPATLAAFQTGYLRHRRHELEQILTAGVRRGQLPASLDVAMTLDLLVGGLLYHLLGLGTLHEERLAERLVQSLLVAPQSAAHAAIRSSLPTTSR